MPLSYKRWFSRCSNKYSVLDETGEVVALLAEDEGGMGALPNFPR